MKQDHTQVWTDAELMESAGKSIFSDKYFSTDEEYEAWKAKCELARETGNLLANVTSTNPRAHKPGRGQNIVLSPRFQNYGEAFNE